MNKIYHYGGSVSCSWADFAKDIVSEAVAIGLIEKNPRIKTIRSEDFPTLAKRPKNSCLNSRRIESVFGTTASNYQKGISKALAALKKLNVN